MAKGKIGEKIAEIWQNIKDNLTAAFFEENNLKKMQEKFVGQEDFKTRVVKLSKCSATVLYLDSMVETNAVSSFVIQPLLEYPDNDQTLKGVLSKTISEIDGQIQQKASDMLSKILNGYCLVFLSPDNIRCISFDTRTTEGRAVIEPPTSSVSRGPREGFVENIKTNMTLLKKRLKTEHFKTQETEVGRYTKTKVAVCYIDEIADKKNIKKVVEKIKNIDIDGIVDSSYLARFLDEDKTGFFITVGTTEKPDIAVAKMLEGRIAIVVDGSPVVLTVPYLFIEDLQAVQDYYESAHTATASRILRTISVAMALFIPALYVSLQTFNYQILPAKFLITIVSATQKIPFKPFDEMVLVLILFDILREANFRMPRFAGVSLSVVGAIVLGDAAVKAGLLGAPAVMIGALSGIGLYAMPENTLIFSILRLAFLLAGRLAGIFGLILFGTVLLSRIVSLSTYGSPYAAPFAPDVLSDKKDALHKAPLEKMLKRPYSIRNENEVRQNDSAK